MKGAIDLRINGKGNINEEGNRKKHKLRFRGVFTRVNEGTMYHKN